MNDRNDTSPPAGADMRSAALRDPANWTESKPPEEIEAEVARTRARLAASLDQLERRLAPKRLLESGLDVFKGSVTRTLEPAQPPSPGREALPPREGSRPLALLAIALAWLAVEHLSRRRTAPRPAPVRHREAAMTYEPAEPAYAGLKPAADAAADTEASGRNDARESRPGVPVATAIDRA
jgi:hypothetical protein